MPEHIFFGGVRAGKLKRLTDEANELSDRAVYDAFLTMEERGRLMREANEIRTKVLELKHGEWKPGTNRDTKSGS